MHYSSSLGEYHSKDSDLNVYRVAMYLGNWWHGSNEVFARSEKPEDKKRWKYFIATGG
jgi:hypothetical protein